MDSLGKGADHPERASSNGHGERDIVRAFVDLHRRRQFTPASRPANGYRVISDSRRSERQLPEDGGGERAGRPGVVVVDHRDWPPTSTAPWARVRLSRPPLPTRSSPGGVASQVDGEDRAIERPPLVQRLEGRLSDLLAIAGAVGALIAPWAWLIGVALFCLVVGAVRSLVADGRSLGAGTAALAGRAAGRVVRLLRPRSLVWLPVLTARTVLVAVAIPGAVGAVWWLSENGTEGLMAAIRIAVWDSGLRVGAGVLCLMMLSGVGDGRARRSALVRRACRRLPDAGVCILAAGAAVVALTVVVAAPRLPGGPLTGADGLGWMPAGLRSTAHGVRDKVVAAELRALGACLTERHGVVWRVRHTAGNPIDELDVAQLSVRGAAGPGMLATAAVAADNQLAPWVEVVEIMTGDTVFLSFDRRALAHDRVRTDAATLAPGAVAGAKNLRNAAPQADRSVALACSAGPVP
ncbi:MAG TPA: hypothetical protein VFZ79_15685 [Acidimicrobiales bacterium]